MRQFLQSEERPSPEVSAIVDDFTHQILGAVERATVELGADMIGDIFARAAGQAGTGRERRAKKRADRERRRIIAGLTKELVGAIEVQVRAQVKQSVALRRRELAAARAAERRAARAAAASGLETVLPRPRRRRKPVRPAPPPLDPEQIKRDAEFARLRAILKPTAAEPAPVVTPPVPPPPPREPTRATTPGDVLRALEKEIQHVVPTLGRLGPERCAAQIAVWAAQVRELRDRLPPDVAATMRPAFRIFLEHLTQLQGAMEAQVVDALEPTFNAPDWDVYIEANRARLEERPPQLSDDKLQVHNRTMLRALILPHRRNANTEAIAIIEAASRGLPASDPQLQSALRRFASLWKSQISAAEASKSGPEAVPTDAPANQEAPATAEPTLATDTPTAEPVAAEDEFESPWLK